MGRPSLAPGMYFRLLLMGYFEGLDSERGMAWRAADSLGRRRFLRIGLEEAPPDHSTISGTRRRGELLERTFAHVYDGRDAAHPPAAPPEHLKAAVAARRGVQPEPGAAPGNRRGHAARPAGPLEPGLFLFLARGGSPGKPMGKLGAAAGDFGGQISSSPASGSAPDRRMKNAISTTGC